MANPSSHRPLDLPVACSLDASAGRERWARWTALSAHARPTIRRQPDQIVIRYPRRDDVVDELHELVAAERECCGFADWQITGDADYVELHIRSGPEGLAALATLLDAG